MAPVVTMEGRRTSGSVVVAVRVTIVVVGGGGRGSGPVMVVGGDVV